MTEFLNTYKDRSLPQKLARRWQCHVYHALTSPVVFNLDSNLWNHVEFNFLLFMIIIVPMVLTPILGIAQDRFTIKLQ